MTTAWGYLLVFLGGGIGAAARHAVNRASLNVIGPNYPGGTLFVNAVGSTMMGLLAGWFAFRGDAGSASMRLFLATGVMGGFTTFSAFALDTALLWERHDVGGALAYIALSVGLSLAGLMAGLFVMRVPLS
jgi:CrcB protein